MKKKRNKIGKFIRRTNCRFCQGTNLVKVLDFGNVPLAGGFLKEKDFEKEKFYPLELNFCKDCTLVQVNNIVPAENLFKNYFYFSSTIKTLVDHFNELANEVYEQYLKNTSKPSVFEIGCNDGALLKPFAALGVKAVGVDPATNVVNSIDAKNITVINDFFSEELALQIKQKYGYFDVLLSSYSFAHIDNMVDIIKGVKCLLKKDGVFIFEVYYLGTLLKEMQYDMIYHEHLSYYSLKALAIFLGRFDMEIFDVKFIPGVRAGAVRFYARNINKRPEKISPAVTEMAKYEDMEGFDKIETCLKFAKKVNTTKKNLLNLLNRLKREGKIIIGYGASGRGTTIMNYCGIDSRYLDYVVDDAPAKHGYYTPGTHLSINPWEFIKKSTFPDYALLFAWSFIDEVRKKRSDYLNEGGKFIVPLPEVKIITDRSKNIPLYKSKNDKNAPLSILILGATGMLGSMVYKYLKGCAGLNVMGTSRKKTKDLISFDVYSGFEKSELDLTKIDFLINCIGITKPYCHEDNMSEVKNAIYVNSLFPFMLVELAEKNNFKVIQVATDCVYSGSRGKYAENALHDALDVYGKTKSLGEVKSKLFLNIRCSIIGPEKYKKDFLLEWFFSQKNGGKVNGFIDRFWNGVTTLQFAKLCKQIITNDKFDELTSISGIHHFVPNDTVSKYELLCLFNKIFEKKLIINKSKAGSKILDFTLSTNFNILSSQYPNSTIKKELEELKKYIDETKFYKD